MLCDFENIGPKLHRCRRCGHEQPSRYDDPKMLKRQCGPSLSQKVGNFAAATVQHVASGLAVVTREERDRRAEICRGCPLFDGRICTHSDCGCPVSAEQRFIDKLSWASSECPVRKW
jgi:hypothetical protein